MDKKGCNIECEQHGVQTQTGGSEAAATTAGTAQGEPGHRGGGGGGAARSGGKIQPVLCCLALV